MANNFASPVKPNLSSDKNTHGPDSVLRIQNASRTFGKNFMADMVRMLKPPKEGVQN